MLAVAHGAYSHAAGAKSKREMSLLKEWARRSKLALAWLILSLVVASCDQGRGFKPCDTPPPKSADYFAIDKPLSFDGVPISLGLPSRFVVEELPPPEGPADIVIAGAEAGASDAFFEFVLYPAGHVFEDYSQPVVPFGSEAPPSTPRALGSGLAGARENEQAFPGSFLQALSFTDRNVDGLPALVVVSTPLTEGSGSMSHRVYIQLADGRLFLISIVGGVCNASKKDQLHLFEDVIESIESVP